MFIHEREDWTRFRWDSDKIDCLQLKAMYRLGYLAGRMSSIGFDNQVMATLEALTSDVVASSEIEGVRLDTDEERTQRGDGDITEWLEWYLGTFIEAVEESSAVLSRVLRKATFWSVHAQASISDCQRMVLNKYFDGYEAKLTAKNWEKIAGVSKDTALRDIEALVRQDILIPAPGRVRDIHYSINFTGRDASDTTSPFIELKIEQEGESRYITAIYDGKPLRDRLSAIDIARIDANEISLPALAYKYFAYVLN